MRPELSVIIVNYNGKSFLNGCLFSLYENLAGIRFEVIIVDNHSADDSVSFLRENHPETKIVESNINLGFGKGNNEGVKHAQGDYLLLINNDTITLDHLQPALDLIKSDPKIGVLGINMLNENKEYLPSCGNFPDFWNMLRLKKLNDISPEFRSGHFGKDLYEVDWIGGAFLLIPKSVYEEIGGFDECYFLYVEDVDLSKMIADKGYKRLFSPKLAYIHFVGFNKAKNPFLIKGYEIFIGKHFTGIRKHTLRFALNINKLVKNSKNAFGLG